MRGYSTLSGWKCVYLAGALIAVFGLGVPLEADTFTLTDNNATVRVDPDLQAGAFAWEVDSIDMLSQDWFWFRTGDVGGERSIETISPAAVQQPLPNLLTIRYADDTVQADLTYILTGGSPGSGESTLAQAVRFKNVGQSPLDLHVFSFANYDVAGTPDNDSGEIFSGNWLVQTDGATSFQVERILSGFPDHHQLDLAPVLLGELNDGNPTTLNDQSGPLGGDIAAAFQFDRFLSPGHALTFSIDARVVPEPGTVVLLLAGLGLGVRRLRRRGRV